MIRRDEMQFQSFSRSERRRNGQSSDRAATHARQSEFDTAHERLITIPVPICDQRQHCYTAATNAEHVPGGSGRQPEAVVRVAVGRRSLRPAVADYGRQSERRAPHQPLPFAECRTESGR